MTSLILEDLKENITEKIEAPKHSHEDFEQQTTTYTPSHTDSFLDHDSQHDSEHSTSDLDDAIVEKMVDVPKSSSLSKVDLAAI